MLNEGGPTTNVLEALEAPQITTISNSLHVGNLKEACPTFKTADGPVRTVPRMLMVDGGSNINLFNNKDVPSLGIPIPGPPVQVSGWSDSVAQSVIANYRIDLQVKYEDGTKRRVTTEVAYSDQGRRDILSESAMWDAHSWSVLKEPRMRVDTPQGAIPLVRLNGLREVN
ncbi:hypothetical protein AB1Y20_008009 [Prymnesium parvum]|uniref:Uncharacterized protein n=1 Tax=Prymnesium parvum TaxID=97485 RepID=A0AB34IT59_PRYPA